MNQSALRLFVRSLILEAKEKKVKDEPKKTIKKEEKAPKSSGKLVDLKKELNALKQYKDELAAAKFAEKTASTEVEFADLAKFAKELEAIKTKGIALEKQIDDKIAELETRISDEKNKIREMIGMSPKKTQKEMVDENYDGDDYDYEPSEEEEDPDWWHDQEMERQGEEGKLKEARFKKGTDIGKKGKGFAKIAKSAAKKYGSEEAGKKVAGAILKKVIKK